MNDTFHLGSQDAGLTFSYDETNPHGMVRLDAGDTMHFLSASETLTLLQWLWERCDTIWKMSQEED